MLIRKSLTSIATAVSTSSRLVACVVVLLQGCAAPSATYVRPDPRPTPEQRFFDWSHLQFDRRVHRQRRENLARALHDRGGGVFLAPAIDGFSAGETFRQLDDFLYFTGLELPNSILAIDADEQRSILFVPRRDARFENRSRANDFPGRPLADDPSLSRESGFDDVRPFDGFAPQMKQWIESGRTLWVNSGRAGGIQPAVPMPMRAWTPAQTLSTYAQGMSHAVKLQNAFEPVADLRIVKSPEEIDVIRRACRITAAGIRHAAGFVRDGVDERTLEAELEAAFKRKGAQRLAFDSIIKSGPNSLWPWRILAAHYDRRNRKMQDGELVIFDVGCELDHYASDVGRTFPVSGRFTPRQRELIKMVTGVTDAMIAAVRPGVTLGEVQAVGVARIPAAERKYMQTGFFFGHHIGLDVGDPSLRDAALSPGMIFTIEPWYYNHDEEIAVFIEDNILVTETGAENLTRALPRTPNELERMTHKR